MLKQGLNQKLLQKLSPQQIQLMKLLQLPAVNLEERIKEEMEANPALEPGAEEEAQTEKEEATLEAESDDVPEMEAEAEVNSEKETEVADEVESDIDSNTEDEIADTSAEDDTDYSDYLDEDEVAEYRTQGDKYSGDEDEKQGTPVVTQRSFHEYLEQQIGMLDLPEEEMMLADYVVGSIDDDGYLRRPLDAMVDDLNFSQNINTSEDQLKKILAKIQQLDPPGTGARDLKECLLLQLTRKEQEHHTEIDHYAIRIIEGHFDEFVKKHYEKLRHHLNVDDELFKKVIDEILKLNPKPGSAYSDAFNPDSFIVPDFVQNVEGKLELSLHGMNIPELRVSNQFKEMLRDYKKSKKKDKQQKEAVMFIKQKIDSAKWFIDAIQQRYNTLYAVMGTIMEYQYDYFLTGDETRLKPMILKDIAEVVHMDISTVSRVANSKYVQTEFGTFKLKSFFSESLSTESGEEVSTREVKKILSDFISLEDKRKPLADEKLTDLLKEKGYNIARRTVAKYREQLNIPVARLRKEL